MNFLSMIGVIVLAIIAYYLLPVLFVPLSYYGDSFGIFVLVAATIIVVILARRSTDEFQKGKLRKFQENFEPKTWAWVLSIMLLVFLFPVDSYVDDGFMLSILIIGLFTLWGYLMRNLAQVSILEFMKKKFVYVIIGLACYLSIGGVYSTYRWVKFVPTYIAKANKEETLIRNRDKVSNISRTDEEIRKEVERWAGPYPLAVNYKSQNSRWWVLWITSAPAYFFTHIIRDFFDYLYTYLAGLQDWFTADTIKNWKKQ